MSFWNQIINGQYSIYFLPICLIPLFFLIEKIRDYRIKILDIDDKIGQLQLSTYEIIEEIKSLKEEFEIINNSLSSVESSIDDIKYIANIYYKYKLPSRD